MKAGILPFMSALSARARRIAFWLDRKGTLLNAHVSASTLIGTGMFRFRDALDRCAWFFAVYVLMLFNGRPDVFSPVPIVGMFFPRLFIKSRNQFVAAFTVNDLRVLQRQFKLIIETKLTHVLDDLKLDHPFVFKII